MSRHASGYRLPDGRTPVLLSSDTDDGLRREAAAVLRYVETHPDVSAGSVADMLMRTRSARRHRALATVTGRDDLVAALSAVAGRPEAGRVSNAAGRPEAGRVSNAAGRPEAGRVLNSAESHSLVFEGVATARSVGFVFPGQGSQRRGMGRMWYASSEAFKDAVDKCEAIFQRLYSISPLSYLLHDPDVAHDEATDDVTIVQPALFMQMIGLAAMWQAHGVTPAATIGHSQGEIAAACVSGIMSLEDGVRVVTVRADLVDTICRANGVDGRYSMVVVGVDRDECDDFLARSPGWAELSVVNSAHILAISVERTRVAEVVDTLTAQGKFAKEIRVAYPAHTSVVSRFSDDFRGGLRDRLDGGHFVPTDIACIGATFGEPIAADLHFSEYWYLNLRNTVRFDTAIVSAAEHGVDTFVEIAEHPTLMLAIGENLSTVSTSSFEVKSSDIRTIGTSRRTATDLTDFTANLASVAVSDLGFDWAALGSRGTTPPALPLWDFPNTQMNSKHLWAAFERTPHRAPEEDRLQPDRLVEDWIRLGGRSLVPPRAVRLVDYAGRSPELEVAVGERLARHGASLTDAAADTVVILLPPSSASNVPTAVSELADFLGDRSWLPDLAGVRDVWLVTVGGEVVVDADVPDVVHAGAQAGFRCLAAEHLGVFFRHVDLDPRGDVASWAKAVVGSIHTAGEPELAVREGSSYAKRLVPLGAAGQPLRGDDVLVLGGTGSLGLEFCEHLATTARRVTVISRTGGSDAARARLDRLGAAAGAEVVVLVCDAGDDAAVRALADDHHERPFDLVVHAAVDYDSAAEELTPGAVIAASASKVVALDTLVRHLPLTADAHVVLCSSVSATIGGRGHTVYAAINRMLDASAAQLRAHGIDCSSVQWGLWREVGADQREALDRISGTGLRPMHPDDAIAAGLTTDAGNCVVASADWHRIRDIFDTYGLGPLFEEVAREPVVPVPAAEPPTDHAAERSPATAPVRDTADRVQFALRTVMGLDATEAIDSSIPLVALGLDSLQALDFRKRIAIDLERDLPVTAILGGASLAEVVTLLANT